MLEVLFLLYFVKCRLIRLLFSVRASYYKSCLPSEPFAKITEGAISLL